MNSPIAALLSSKSRKVKRLRRLSHHKKARQLERAFLIEGEVLLKEALAADCVISEVFVSIAPDERESDLSATLVDVRNRFQLPLEIAVNLVEERAFNSSLRTVSPQPFVAIAEIPTVSYEQLFLRASDGLLSTVVVLVDVRDPGNVGTLLRSAEAAGAAGVVIAGNSVEAHSPKVIRSAAGAVFRMPIIVEPDPLQVCSFLSEKGWQTVATVVENDQSRSDVHSYTEFDITQSAFFLGNEAHGLKDGIISACDVSLTIPLAGPTESLNIAAAGAVLCFEASRQSQNLLAE